MTKGDDVGALGPRQLALTGVTVVEVGGSLASRLLGKLLADQGAAVGHVVVDGVFAAPFDFDGSAAPAALDLSTAEGRSSLLGAVAAADVVVDGLGGGGLDRFGIGYAALADANPRALCCKLSAMPPEAQRDAMGLDEWVIAGELGLHRAGVAAAECEPLSLVNAYGALQAALYLAAGLIQRDRHGTGARIDVSLFGAAVMALNRRLLNVADPRFADPLGKFRLPIAERYRCADGRFLQSQGAVDTVASGVLRAMGHPEWVDEALVGITAFESKDEEDLWRQRFTDVYASRNALDWETAIAAEGGAGALCRTRQEWSSERHARDAEIFVSEGPDRVAVGPGIRVFSPEANPTTTVTWPAAESDERLPLAGLRVIDLAIILAGPTCGRLLGELGADVIKIDAPDRTDLPWVSPWGWLDVNRTKRSVLLDLKTEEGREVLWRLIDDADVLVENYRAGKIADLGFSFEAVARRNPRIVHVSMNAYDFGGEFAERPGWEQNAQAMTGMQQSRAKNGLPRQVLVPLNDFGTGYLGAFGAMLGILSARTTGRAQRVLGSLSRTGTFIQMLEYGQRTPLPNVPDVEFLDTSDGQVGVAGGGLDPSVLREAVKGLATAEAVAALAERGLAVAPGLAPERVPGLDWVRAAGLVASWRHPSWGEMTNVFAHANATTFEQRRGWPAQNPGQETRVVLKEAGYSDTEIEGLVGRRVAFDERPLFRER